MDRTEAIREARRALAGGDAEQALARLWDLAYEQGKIDALDELQVRFCVCMK